MSLGGRIDWRSIFPNEMVVWNAPWQSCICARGGGRLDLYSKFVGEYIFVLVAFLYI